MFVKNLFSADVYLTAQFEDITRGIADPKEAERQIRDFLQTRGRGKIDSMIWAKIKKGVSEEFRDFYMEGLWFNPSQRYGDADIARRELASSIEKTTTEYKMRNAAKNHGVGVLVPLFLIATLTLSGFLRKYNTNLPPKPSLQGPMYELKNSAENIERFEVENLQDLPSVTTEVTEETERVKQMIAGTTHDSTTAYLLTQYDQAMRRLGRITTDFRNEEQFRIWAAHSTGDERNFTSQGFYKDYQMVEKNIEVALNQARLPNGSIDLEDVCAIARLGSDQVNLAKRAANSFNFSDYIQAKNPRGEPIIPGSEQLFLNTWLAYIKENSQK